MIYRFRKEFFVPHPGYCLPFLLLAASTTKKPILTDDIPDFPSHLETSIYFSCDAGEHISRLGVCDGIPDCFNSEDEINCTQLEGKNQTGHHVYTSM